MLHNYSKYRYLNKLPNQDATASQSSSAITGSTSCTSHKNAVPVHPGGGNFIGIKYYLNFTQHSEMIITTPS